MSEEVELLKKKERELLYAAKSNKSQLVKDIITLNPKLVNVIDSYGYSPILYAVENQNVEMTQFLVDKGANIYQISLLEDDDTNNAFTMGMKLGNTEIIDILNKRSLHFWQENNKMVRNSSNPFTEYDIKDFLSWEVTNFMMPFPRLATSQIQNGPISDAEEVRTFIGAYKSTMMLERIYNSNIFEQPRKKSLEVPLARMIIIDILPTPNVTSYGTVDIRKNFLNLLKLDESYKTRKLSLANWSIDYIVDYDLDKIVSVIEKINIVE